MSNTVTFPRGYWDLVVTLLDDHDSAVSDYLRNEIIKQLDNQEY